MELALSINLLSAYSSTAGEDKTLNWLFIKLKEMASFEADQH